MEKLHRQVPLWYEIIGPGLINSSLELLILTAVIIIVFFGDTGRTCQQAE